MLMRRGRPIGLCIQRLFLSTDDGPFKYEFIGTASRCTARVLLWPLRPAQVCWSSAARKAASSLTSCLLRALRWPLPPARLPPHLALPQPVAESESAPTAQLRPGVVRGCLCGKFLCRWGSKARAPSVSLRLWRWLPAGPTARAGLHRCCLLTAGHEGASPPQVPREREGVHGGEPAVAAARCGGDPVVLEALRPQGVWPLPWTLLLPSQQSGSAGGVPAKPPPCP